MSCLAASFFYDITHVLAPKLKRRSEDFGCIPIDVSPSTVSKPAVTTFKNGANMFSPG